MKTAFRIFFATGFMLLLTSCLESRQEKEHGTEVGNGIEVGNSHESFVDSAHHYRMNYPAGFQLQQVARNQFLIRDAQFPKNSLSIRYVEKLPAPWEFARWTPLSAAFTVAKWVEDLWHQSSGIPVQIGRLKAKVEKRPSEDKWINTYKVAMPYGGSLELTSETEKAATTNWGDEAVSRLVFDDTPPDIQWIKLVNSNVVAGRWLEINLSLSDGQSEIGNFLYGAYSSQDKTTGLVRERPPFMTYLKPSTRGFHTAFVEIPPMISGDFFLSQLLVCDELANCRRLSTPSASGSYDLGAYGQVNALRFSVEPVVTENVPRPFIESLDVPSQTSAVKPVQFGLRIVSPNGAISEDAGVRIEFYPVNFGRTIQPVPVHANLVHEGNSQYRATFRFPRHINPGQYVMRRLEIKDVLGIAGVRTADLDGSGRALKNEYRQSTLPVSYLSVENNLSDYTPPNIAGIYIPPQPISPGGTGYVDVAATDDLSGNEVFNIANGVLRPLRDGRCRAYVNGIAKPLFPTYVSRQQFEIPANCAPGQYILSLFTASDRMGNVRNLTAWIQIANGLVQLLDNFYFDTTGISAPFPPLNTLPASRRTTIPVQRIAVENRAPL